MRMTNAEHLIKRRHSNFNLIHSTGAHPKLHHEVQVLQWGLKVTLRDALKPPICKRSIPLG